MVRVAATWEDHRRHVRKIFMFAQYAAENEQEKVEIL